MVLCTHCVSHDKSRLLGIEDCQGMKPFIGGHSRGGSESGWTMYIGSHISGAENYNHDYGHSGNRNNHHHKGVDVESDDSMASDASSGPPSHQEFPCLSEEGRPRTNCFKHTNDDDDNDDEYSSKSYPGKSKKEVKQRGERRAKPGKEKPGCEANSAASYAGSKVRKNK